MIILLHTECYGSYTDGAYLYKQDGWLHNNIGPVFYWNHGTNIDSWNDDDINNNSSNNDNDNNNDNNNNITNDNNNNNIENATCTQKTI